MKRTERHHLKENAVALSVSRAKESFERHQGRIFAGAIGVVVLILAIGAYFVWRGRVDSQSRVALAEAMNVVDAPVVPPTPPTADQPAGATPATAPAPPPPGSYPSEQARLQAALSKFRAVAEQYPSTDAGIAARYHEAAALAALGRTAEAVSRFKEVIDRDGSGLYGDAARLGLANAQGAGGDYEAAIAGYRELSTRTGGNLPIDGILMQLGRTYLIAGKTDE
ncbi:MAG: hypothetical protein EHM13_03415, partial [Acidobacteria bacterium]